MNVEQYVCKKRAQIWTKRDHDISLLTVVDPKSVVFLPVTNLGLRGYATHVTLHSKYKAVSPANTKR